MSIIDIKNFLTSTPTELPIRKGFGEGLLIAGERDARIVGLCADLTESTQMHLFAQKFPQRFFEVGVSEQNLASVASGFAASGKTPVISSYAMFSPGRNWEQIRTTICYNDQKVVIAGSHAGISVGPDGGSHQAIEDIAITRVIPNLIVLSPCDAIEARKATMAALRAPEKGGPKSAVYIRLAREKTPVLTKEDTPFEIGKAQVLYKTTDFATRAKKVTIFVTGSLTYQAVLAVPELEVDGVGVSLVNIATIKPLDVETVVAEAKASGRGVTVEEHQIAGGMGSAIAECLAQHNPVPLEFVGMHDEFGQTGTPAQLIQHYGMDRAGIIAAVKKVLAR